MKIKQGDNVMVISGKDKGKVALVERVLTKNNKVLVTGVAMAKHHLKPSTKNPHGGIINMPAPIASSNVMLVCPHCGKPVRIAYRIGTDMKERICRKCQGNLDSQTQTSKISSKVTTKVTTKAKTEKKTATPKVKEKNV